MLYPTTIQTSSFYPPKTHVVGMIKIITAIVTHTVILESFVLTIDNCLTFNR